MESPDELVTVVIPAYNAEKTLPETLRSVCSQTHRALEILVIDDGSKDRTAEVAEAHARLDGRIRLVTQTNGGVAKARNNGIDMARGEYVAPVDADDLWRPRKIERELRALRVGGPDTGLAYSWSAVIDEHSQITSLGGRPSFQGDVLNQLFHGNFVGNGSCALMRKNFVLDAGGYDPDLKAQKAQGCEDWKLYLLLAERSHFAAVPDHLVGYRYTPSAMSGDVAQMLRSHAIVRAEMVERHPNAHHQLDWANRHYLEWLLRREFEQQHWKNCKTIIEELGLKGQPLRFGKRYWRTFASATRNRIRERADKSSNDPFLAPPPSRPQPVSDASDSSLHPQSSLTDEELAGSIVERLERQ